jgi:two-component system response regulator HydG
LGTCAESAVERRGPDGANADPGADRLESRGRVVAATDVDQNSATASRQFRSDLCFPLAVIPLGLPALRDHIADVLPLAQHFVSWSRDRLALPPMGLSPAAARALLAHTWPGNVRELENAKERAVAMADTAELYPGDLREDILAPGAARDGGLVSTADLERAHIRRVLDATDGNKSRAAKILGPDRRTLHRKLKRH